MKRLGELFLYRHERMNEFFVMFMFLCVVGQGLAPAEKNGTSKPVPYDDEKRGDVT